MLSVFSITFWMYFVFFFGAVFISFFIPGDLALRKLNLSNFQRFVIGIVVGMVLWGWQGFVFGYLGFRWLTYFYLLVTFLFWLRMRSKNFFLGFLESSKVIKIDWLLAMMIFLGVFIQISSVFFNGVLFKDGLYFCCGNVEDGILHIALTNQIVSNFPPFEPGMYGVVVKNYHYWGSLVLGELIRIFRLPLISTQYQYSMLFISLFLGFTAIVFGQILNLGKTFIRWLAFFLYFGGDLIFFLVSLIRKEINFNMSSIEDGAKFLVNPPRAFSIVIFFAGISLFVLWLRRKDLRTGIISTIMLGSLIGFKVYTGLFVLSGVAILIIYFLIKRNFRSILLLLMIPIISLIIYLPVNSGAGGLYFTGFYIFENFIVQPWMMLDRLEHARVIYYQHSSWLRVAQYELIYIFLYIFLVFGTKLVGLFQTKKSLSLLPKELNLLLVSGIGISAIAGFFFQQKSGGANTFNFLVSIFIIGSIYSALACSYWSGMIKSKIKVFLIVLIVFLTIPRVLHDGIINIINIENRNGFFISSKELDAVKYIKGNTNKESLILVDYNQFKMDGISPYVSFLTNRSMFLSGMGNELSAHGIDYKERKAISDLILNSHERKKIGMALLKGNVDYIYLSPWSNIAIESDIFYQKVFENQKVVILRVLPDAIRKYTKL